MVKVNFVHEVGHFCICIQVFMTYLSLLYVETFQWMKCNGTTQRLV